MQLPEDLVLGERSHKSDVMKKVLLLFAAVIATLCGHAQDDFRTADGGKAALLMVHFGTTFDDTRALTIDAINDKAREAFPDMRVEEAYTSRIVISRLKKRGIVKLTPREALLRLAADGYTHVFVQGTNVIDGIEAESLRNEVEGMARFFKDIRVGRPLLYSVEDCRTVAGVLAARYAGHAEGKDVAVVLVGHGTETPATAIYSQMEYVFAAEGYGAFHVSTVEGYPTRETTVARMKADKVKRVTLVPFMFVAGDHARNDIDGDWRGSLESEGYKVETVIEGLGQIPGIQDVYIEHIRQGMREKPLTATQLKSEFIKDNL